MSNTRDKYFNFMRKFINEMLKVTDSSGEKYYHLFRRLITDAKKLKDEEIDKINARELKYQLSDKQKKSSRKKAIKPDFNVEVVAKELEHATSREQGETILTTYCNPNRKKDFHSLLKYLKIPYKDPEKILQLKEKIIDNTIGYSISSQTIQNYGKDKK
jgi:hypothetical protein